MATVEEKSLKHEERPATHHKRAQTYMLALAIFVVVLFAVSAYSRIQNGPNQLFTERDTTQPRMQRQPPKATRATFEEQVALAKKKLARQLERGDASIEEPLETPSLPDTSHPITWPPEETQVSVDGGATEQEEKMVLKSRTADLTVNLGFTAPSARREAERHPISPTPQKRSIDEEIARVRALRAQLQAQAGSSAPTASPVALASGLASRPSPTSFSTSAPASSPTVVGQTISSRPEPLPGQQLLPLTTVIRAVLDQKVMSDYVGPLRLLVVNDVYDVANRHILIPSGSKVLAHSLLISNINAPIQSRMGITVEAMVLPNGTSIDFSRQAALDREGIAAVEGSTDYHLLEQFLGVAAFALISTGTSRAGSGANADTTFQGELGQEVRRQFSPLLQRYLALVPTITLSPGTPMRIFLQEELWITPWQPVGQRFVAGRS